MSSSPQKSVLFVCLGNICRSPIAEAIFIDLITKRGERDNWHVDSSAVIGYHTGKGPERRTMETLRKFGITDYEHRARVTSTADFKEFDYIFGMDDSNISDLKEIERLAGKESKAKLALLGSFDPEGHRIVPDPYYAEGVALFNQVYHQCVRCCTAFLDQLKRDLTTALNWPVGAVCTQAAHAASAAMWLFRDDPNTLAYTTELDSMHKVTLGVDSEEELLKVVDKLKEKQLDHKVWIEDDQPVCIALKPYSKSDIKNTLRNLKLF